MLGGISVGEGSVLGPLKCSLRGRTKLQASEDFQSVPNQGVQVCILNSLNGTKSAINDI